MQRERDRRQPGLVAHVTKPIREAGRRERTAMCRREEGQMIGRYRLDRGAPFVAQWDHERLSGLALLDADLVATHVSPRPPWNPSPDQSRSRIGPATKFRGSRKL